MQTFIKGCLSAALLGVLVLVAFAGGFLANGVRAGALAAPAGAAAPADTAPDAAARPANFAVFQEAMRLLNGDFYGELPQGQQVTYAAIRGVLARLGDPNTILVEPEAHEREQEQFQGEFGGIGAQVTLDERGRLVIVAPLVDTPAARADLRPNDVIAEVDGTPIVDMTVEEAIALIRGPVGTQVTLLVQRGEAEPFSLTLTRETIPDPTVDHRLIEGTTIGYIGMHFFSARTTDELRAAIEALRAQGATKFVLDLRNNPGGLLDAAIGTASLFVEDGVVAYQQRRDGSRAEERARGGAILTTEPMVVLINEGSASASEILAGALQSSGRAALLGTQSYGKGTVQIPYTLSDGSSLHVTVAHWLTPNGTDLSSQGLTPDETIQTTEEQRQAGVDPVFDRAIQRLQEIP